MTTIPTGGTSASAFATGLASASAIPSTSTSLAEASAAATVADSQELGSDAFLTLLVAQLKYQDPMNPAKGAEFLAQTAQFTMVQKLNELATQNEIAIAGQQALQATSMAGRDISWTDAAGFQRNGIVNRVELRPEGPMLLVGNEEIRLDAVASVGASAGEGISSTDSLLAALGPTLAQALTESGIVSDTDDLSSTTAPAATAPSTDSSTVPAADGISGTQPDSSTDGGNADSTNATDGMTTANA